MSVQFYGFSTPPPKKKSWLRGWFGLPLNPCLAVRVFFLRAMFYRMRYKRDPPPPSLGPINDSEYTLSHISALVISQQQHATNCGNETCIWLENVRKRRLKPSKNSIKTMMCCCFSIKKTRETLGTTTNGRFLYCSIFTAKFVYKWYLSGRWRPWWMRCTLPFTRIGQS